MAISDMEVSGVKFSNRDALSGIFKMLATTYDRKLAAKQAGKPIVGSWLASPHELCIAAGAYAEFYPAEIDTFRAIVKGKYELEKYVNVFGIGDCFCLDVCTSVGNPVSGAPLQYDLVVTDFTPKLEKWDDLFYEISSKRDIFPLEVPKGLTRSEVYEYIYNKLNELKQKLEEKSGKKISDEDLVEACEKTNKVREYLRHLDNLLKADPIPLRSCDIFFSIMPAGGAYFGSDVDGYIRILERLIAEIEERVENGVGVYPERAPRLLIIGNYHKVLYPILEKHGGVFVADWPCADHGGKIYRDAIEIGNDPMASLANHYLKSHGLFGPKEDMKEIMEMVRRLDIDGVIWDKQTDQWGWAPIWDSYELAQEYLPQKGIPVLSLSSESFKDPLKLDADVQRFLEVARGE